MNSYKFLLFSISFSICLVSGGNIAFAAWLDAPAGPPNYGASSPSTQADYKPVNLGSVAQIKTGGLTVARLETALGSFTNNNSSTSGLLVSGNATGNPGYAGYRITLDNGTANYAGFVRGVRTSGTSYIGLEVGSETNHGIRFLTNGTGDSAEKMRINANGNVGIGTTAPVYKLDVAGRLGINVAGTAVAPQLVVEGDGASYNANIALRRANAISAGGNLDWLGYTNIIGARIGVNDDIGGAMQFKLGGTGVIGDTKLIITSAGNVGIGTINPGYRLDIQGGQINASGGLCIAGDCKTSWAQVSGSGGVSGPSGNSGYDSYLPKWTDSAQKILGNSDIFNSGGNVGIGTGTDLTGITGIGNLKVAGNIYVGGFGTAASGWFTSSDARLKTNITPLKNVLPRALLLQGMNYERIGDASAATQVGFIAQDVEKLFPEVVRTDSQGYKSVAYDKLTPILLEAIKELNAKVERLESRP